MKAVLPKLRHSLRWKLLAAHILVIAAGLATLLLATVAIAPALFDRLMLEVTGPRMRALGHVMSPVAEEAMRDLTAEAFRQAFVYALAWGAMGAVVAAVAVSALLSGQIARPVLNMVLASRRIAAGRYAERVPSVDPDELGQLATSFNEMASSLEAVERRRLELIGDVAHELRTPIANLQGYLEGLEDGVVEPSRETWAFLLSETGRLRRLVEDLQELSRAEARQLPLSLRPLSPARLVELAIARLGAQFTEKGLALHATVPSDLPRVLADEGRAVQVLTNLLGNALRYTPSRGRVEVVVGQEGDEVSFHVLDTGVGIAAEHLPHLFERFYRVDKARSRASGGSGIGLTIARSLVEAMGGRIWAESPGVGQGSTFSFTLPVAR